MCTMLFKIKNLEYQKSNKKILSNLNFDVEKGKHLLILGSSGSGKTSLINIMSGFITTTSYSNRFIKSSDVSPLHPTFMQ